MKYWPYIVALSALSLSACGSSTVKDTLGLTRSAPDEFRVVSRPPLSVPPQFTLRPPSNGSDVPGQKSASDQAESLVMGGKAVDTAVEPVSVKDTSKRKTVDNKASGAESQFLKNAGADKADPKIRDSLVEEQYSIEDKKDKSSWWDVIPADTDKKEPLVDAKKEADRIKKNDQEGEPVVKGETPEVKDKDTGVLGKIFGY